MRERERHKFSAPVHIFPDDTLCCRIHDRRTGKMQEFTETIGRKMKVDTIVTFDVDEPILGLADGIGAIFGKAKEN